MKKYALALFAILSATTLFAQTPEENEQLKALNDKVLLLEKTLHEVESQATANGEQIKTIETQLSNQNGQIQTINKSLAGVNSQQSSTKKEVENLKAGQTTLGEQVVSNTNELKQTSDNLNDQIASTKSEVKTVFDDASSKIKTQGVVFTVIALLLFAIAILSYLLLRKNIKSSAVTIDEVKKAQDKLQQESLGLDEKLMEVLNKKMTIEKELTPSSAEPDHSLALKVADEIVRIETNLTRMDSSVKGYKQLSASLRRIKDNFAANGYEIVDMLGKPYTEGMRATVNYVSDETLEDGAQIITGIIKPQINYNGKMIQSAQITVSQN